MAQAAKVKLIANSMHTFLSRKSFFLIDQMIPLTLSWFFSSSSIFWSNKSTKACGYVQKDREIVSIDFVRVEHQIFPKSRGYLCRRFIAPVAFLLSFSRLLFASNCALFGSTLFMHLLSHVHESLGFIIFLIRSLNAPPSYLKVSFEVLFIYWIITSRLSGDHILSSSSPFIHFLAEHQFVIPFYIRLPLVLIMWFLEQWRRMLFETELLHVVVQWVSLSGPIEYKVCI